MNAVWYRLPALAAMASLLCGCYANFNQFWYRSKRDYTGYSIRHEGARSLPHVLYRCGEAWYIAAQLCEIRDDYPGAGVQFIGNSYYERHHFTPRETAAVCYHKITPALAQMLLRSDQETDLWFSPAALERELAAAGGQWEPELPKGAVAVPAEYLRFCRSSVLLVKETSRARWYTHAAAGATFLCVDLPLSAALMSATSVVLISHGVTLSDKGVSMQAQPPENAHPEYPTHWENGQRLHHRGSRPAAPAPAPAQD